MSKSLEELLLGAENQAAAVAAVRRAVKRAEAAGLPPAYQTESGAFAWMPKSTEELLFGVENQAAVSEAVRRAVERADALGLPRAYKRLPAELQDQEEQERQLNQAGQDRA